MKRKNSPLTQEERKEIKRLVDLGDRGAAIAKFLGRGKNTVIVELRRNGGRLNYDPIKAHDGALERRRLQTGAAYRNFLRGNVTLEDEVAALYKSGLSFLQILEQKKLSVPALSSIFKRKKLPRNILHSEMSALINRVTVLEAQLGILQDEINELNKKLRG